ncbi:hypothetical protein ACS0TY_010948 [Phlomoides rotata]
MIDFNRNYLSGNIPREWASIKLEYLSVSVNRLSGPIPKYLGNITTLEAMSLETNQFNGPVPSAGEADKLRDSVRPLISELRLEFDLQK